MKSLFSKFKKKSKIVAQFRIDKPINRQSYHQVLKAVQRAQPQVEKMEAVAFVINSPGGSPVYSSLIGERVASFAKNNGLPYYTFAEDVAASGGYWLLCQGKLIHRLSDPYLNHS